MAALLAAEVKNAFPDLPLVFHTHYQTGYGTHSMLFPVALPAYQRSSYAVFLSKRTCPIIKRASTAPMASNARSVRHVSSARAMFSSTNPLVVASGLADGAGQPYGLTMLRALEDEGMC